MLEKTTEMLEKDFEEDEKHLIRKLLDKIDSNLEKARGGNCE